MENSVAFYDRFEYPFQKPRPGFDVSGANYLKALLFELRASRVRPEAVLDAGCGAGHRTADIARTFPRSKVLGVDISEASLAIARQQQLLEGLENLSYESQSVLDELPGGFDVVTATGVLHHLQDPLTALKNIRRSLTDRGLAVLWLYHSYGEFERMLDRSLVRLLWPDRDIDYDEGLRIVRQLSLSISSDRYGKSFGEKADEDDLASRDADAFLNPHVLTYTFREAIELVRSAGFQWCSIEQVNFAGGGQILSMDPACSLPYATGAEGLFASEELKQRVGQAAPGDALSILELKVKPTGFLVIAGGEGSFALGSPRVQGNRRSADALAPLVAA